MQNPLLRSLELRDELSPSERSVIDMMIRTVRHVPARRDFVVVGDRPDNSCVLLSGLAARTSLLGDGRRQISAVHVPGDFPDLHSLLVDEMDHSIEALTDCVIALVPHEMLRDLTRSEPHLMRMLWLLTSIDAAIIRQWLVASARLKAECRIARFFCEIHERLRVVGLATGFGFDFPLTQTDLSDAMGLSLVHVNKILQRMRREELIQWQESRLRLLDWSRLTAMAEFDPAYLDLKRSCR